MQAQKFNKAAIGLRWKKDQEDQQAQYKPVEPFVGKVLNWYFESTKGKGKEEAKIENIMIEQDGQLVLYLKCDGKFSKQGTRIMFYDKAKDSWFISDNITPWRSQGEYGILGTDMPTAQMLVKITKAYNPESKIGPNGLIKGAQTPILGKVSRIRPATCRRIYGYDRANGILG